MLRRVSFRGGVIENYLPCQPHSKERAYWGREESRTFWIGVKKGIPKLRDDQPRFLYGH